MLKEAGYEFDVAFTSVLTRARHSLELVSCFFSGSFVPALFVSKGAGGDWSA